MILLKIKGNNSEMSSDYFLQFLQPHAELSFCSEETELERFYAGVEYEVV